MRIARGVIGFVMVLGIGGTVAWGARRYVKTSPRFAVSEVITTGAKRRSPEELSTIAGIAKGQNVFSAENVTPLIYKSGVDANAQTTLNAVSAKLTTQDLLAMMTKLVTDDGRTHIQSQLMRESLLRQTNSEVRPSPTPVRSNSPPPPTWRTSATS